MRNVFYVLGFLCLALGVFQLVPACLAAWDGSSEASAFFLCAGVSIVVGGIASYLNRDFRDGLHFRQAFLIVTLSWVLAAIVGGLPYYVAGLGDPVIAAQLPTFIDCVFESASGFSTTGSSVMGDIESLPRGLLLWRSCTHWLGGMGIVVLSIAILPLLGGGGMSLYKAEAPGTILPDKLAPRIAETARSMWRVYIMMTIAETGLLMVGGMTFFDAICHSFGTVATGGFSTKNASIAHYQSDFIHWVIIFFMLLAGINFFLHYQYFIKGKFTYLKDVECRFWLLLVGSGLAFFLLNTYDLYTVTGTWIRDCCFTVLTIITTTGYGSADFELWPQAAQLVILALMVVGGSTGSTSGGSKALRILILVKAGYREIRRLIHPHGVIPVRVGSRAIPDETVASVLGFFTCVVGVFLVVSLVLTLQGVDLMTGTTATLSCIFNIGPGLGSVGPTENFAAIPQFSKLCLSLCMIMGRLEIYTVLVLFSPEFYRK